MNEENTPEFPPEEEEESFLIPGSAGPEDLPARLICSPHFFEPEFPLLTRPISLTL